MKQTAVDWLEEQTRTQDWHSLKRGEIIDQAKKMEKEQIKHAYIQGCMDLVKSSEAYYNKQFKNKVE